MQAALSGKMGRKDLVSGEMGRAKQSLPLQQSELNTLSATNDIRHDLDVGRKKKIEGYPKV